MKNVPIRKLPYTTEAYDLGRLVADGLQKRGGPFHRDFVLGLLAQTRGEDALRSLKADLEISAMQVENHRVEQLH